VTRHLVDTKESSPDIHIGYIVSEYSTNDGHSATFPKCDLWSILAFSLKGSFPATHATRWAPTLDLATMFTLMAQSRSFEPARLAAPDAAARRATWIRRLTEISRSRGWGWPIASLLVSVVAVISLATFHRLIDLGTYRLGGANAFSAHLYHVVYAPTHLGFTYPPFAALVFAPLSLVPPTAGQISFSLVSLACLIALLIVCLSATCAELSHRELVWWSLVLVTPVGLLDPVRETLLLGQVNIVLALMVIADMTVVRETRRGVFVGLAGAVKLTPLILLPYLLLTRQRRAAVRTLAAFLGATAVGALVSPRASWQFWTHDAFSTHRAGWVPWVGNQGVIGVAERLLHHTLTTPSTVLVASVVAIVGLWVSVRAYDLSSPLLGLLVVEATESLASPVSWTHHYVWLILLVAWLLLAQDRPVKGERWVLVVSVFVWAAPFWWVPHGPSIRFAGSGWSILVANSFAIMLASVIVAGVVRVVHVRRRATLSRRSV
jgi:alpha-1,2-mannosyltransferase